MHKCLTVAVVVLLHTGCRDTTEQPDAIYNQEVTANGKFLVPQEELPPQIVELARTLRTLPTISSDSDFRSALTQCGLNKEPDHYKDFGHFWFLDREFKSETDPGKRLYRVAIGHVPRPKSGIAFYWAAISREHSTERSRGMLWEIEWPRESAD